MAERTDELGNEFVCKGESVIHFRKFVALSAKAAAHERWLCNVAGKDGQDVQSGGTSSRRGNDKCYVCGHCGHWSRDCPSRVTK